MGFDPKANNRFLSPGLLEDLISEDFSKGLDGSKEIKIHTGYYDEVPKEGILFKKPRLVCV